MAISNPKKAASSTVQPKRQGSTQLARKGSGLLGDLSPKQEETLQKFRAAVEKEGLLKPNDTLGTDDVTLLRFLRARSFHLHKSLDMLKECQRWRSNAFAGKSIDQLYEEIDPFDFEKKAEIFQYWPMCFHGVDKKDRPINYQRFGSISTKGLYSAATPEYHWKTVLVNCEALPREVLPAISKVKGRLVDNAHCIVDLEGLSLSQFWDMKDLAKGAFWVSQNIYPETMGIVQVVNAPSSFVAIWKSIKGWLSPQTQEKVVILGTDYQKTLLESVDADQLPVELGGTCQCPEGCMMSSKGPWKTVRNRGGGASQAAETDTHPADHPPRQEAPIEEKPDRIVPGGPASASISPPDTGSASLATPFFEPGEAPFSQLQAARNDDVLSKQGL